MPPGVWCRPRPPDSAASAGTCWWATLATAASTPTTRGPGRSVAGCATRTAARLRSRASGGCALATASPATRPPCCSPPASRMRPTGCSGPSRQPPDPATAHHGVRCRQGDCGTGPPIGIESPPADRAVLGRCRCGQAEGANDPVAGHGRDRDALASLILQHGAQHTAEDEGGHEDVQHGQATLDELIATIFTPGAAYHERVLGTPI